MMAAFVSCQRASGPATEEDCRIVAYETRIKQERSGDDVRCPAAKNELAEQAEDAAKRLEAELAAERLRSAQLREENVALRQQIATDAASAADEVAAAKEAAKRAAHESRALRKWIGNQLVEPDNFDLSVAAIAKCLEKGKIYGLIRVTGNLLRAYCRNNSPAESLQFLTDLGLDEDTANRLRDGPPKKARKKAGAAPPAGVESHASNRNHRPEATLSRRLTARGRAFHVPAACSPAGIRRCAYGCSSGRCSRRCGGVRDGGA